MTHICFKQIQNISKMSFFKKIFGSNEEFAVDSQQIDQDKQQSVEQELTKEETFSIAFKNNGGKFLFCENFEEVKSSLEDILEENDWFESDVLCNEPQLFPLLKDNNLNHVDILNQKFLFATCESLIAEDGSILFCSTQIKQCKPNALPNNIIVFSTTSRIENTRNEALSAFQGRYKSPYPDNVTAIKYFEKSQEEDFLQYGSSAKNIYLLLLEE
ncbi:MAG: hypothetical protein RLZZ312_1648 [Bacteroidota bacterium]